MTNLRCLLVAATLAGLLAVTVSHAATITVTSGADSGSGTLRQALLDTTSGDTRFRAGRDEGRSRARP